MKRITLLMSLFFIASVTFGQSYYQFPEDLDKLTAQREASVAGKADFVQQSPVELKADPIDLSRTGTCPEGTFMSNPPDGGTAYTSSTDADLINYQYFSGAADMIGGISFWAIQGYFTGAWAECTQSPMDIQIKFYQDNSGLPGTEVYTETVSIVPVPDPDVTFGTWTVKSFMAYLNAPVSLTAGWFSVAATNSPTCWILVVNSNTGTGANGYYSEGVWTSRDLPQNYCFLAPLAEDNAPGAPTNFTVTAGAMGALSADLAWTNPSLTFDGEPLTQLDEVKIMRDGVVIHTITNPVIGAAATYTDNSVTEAGTYTYAVYGANTAGDGPAASASAYIGEDVPAAPGDVTLVAVGNNGQVNWTAPTEGLNGGYLSGDGLTYTVVRMPGNVEVATDITETEFLDTTVPGIGNYSYRVTVSNAIGLGGNATSNTALLGAEGILLYETFDYPVGTIPPGWFKEAELDPDGNNAGDGLVNWAVSNTNTAGGTAPQMRFTWNPRFEGMSRLVTHAIDTDGNQQLRLKFRQFLSNFAVVAGNTLSVRVTFDGGDTFETIWHHVITASMPAQLSELYIDIPEDKSTFHIAWEFNGDAYQINNWDLDNIILEPVVANDLVALSISGNTTPSEGVETVYTVNIQNAGTATQSSYNVKLMQQGGVELVSVAGETIEFGETMSYHLSWTPPPGSAGATAIYGLIDFAGDEVPGNNQTANLNIVIQPGDIIAVTIGDGTLLTTQPYNMVWDYSLQQTLYYPEEIGLGGGVITGIQYVNSFNVDWPNRHIQIWLGETGLENLADGWVDPSTLELVFDGFVDFPEGVNNIYIPFDDIYVYGGGNLVIYNYKMDDEWAGSKNFFNTDDPASSRTRRAQQDNNPYDPANPPVGAISHSFPNITMFFSTAGLGALEGNVTDGTDPLEGVLVRVLGTNSSTLTDAAGDYEFPYLLPETYNVEFSKYGYETTTITGVVIEEDEVTVADAVINAIPQYTVTGIVEGNDDILQEGAMVSLQGYDDYMVMTGADGSFEIEDVFEGTYTLTVAAAGYELYVDETVEVDGADLDLGTITVIEIIVPPSNLQVDVDGQDEGNALLTWSDVAEREFRYDDGTATGQLGSGGGTLLTVLGSAHRNDAVLAEMSWYLTAEGGPHNTVKVWVFGLNANGNPNPQDVLYEMAGVPNTDMQWNTYEFTTPVEAPNGFLIGLSYAGFLGIGTDAGTSTDWPFMTNSNFFVANYTTGPFAAIEGLGAFPFNFLIRAFGVDNGAIDFGKEYADQGNSGIQDVTYNKLPEPVVTGFPIYNNHNSVASKAFTGYNVFLNGVPVATETTEMEYLFEDLDEGTYTAGVQSVYTTGTSPIITVDFDMVFGVPVTFTVTTNSGDSPEGAHVLLTNQDHDQYVYEHTVGADGVAHFETVRKGMYTLHVTHDLFHDYIVEDINIQDTFTYTAELVEIIVAPYGLMVETEDLDEGDAYFSWNNVMGTTLFEDFEGGSMPEDWTQVITNTVTSGPTPATWSVTNYSSTDFSPFGTYHAGLWWDFGNQNEWLISPEVSIGPDYEFEFWSAVFLGSTNADHYYVKISLDGGSSWTELWDASAQSGGWNYYASPFIIDLSMYSGQDVHFAFHAIDGPSNDGLWYIWFVDNVSVGPEGDRNTIAMSKFERMSKGAVKAVEGGEPQMISRDGTVTMPAAIADRAHVGYNVFLNGAQVATEITDTDYMFIDLPGGNHVAGVQSVYTSGVSEIVTIDFEIEITEPDTFPVTFTVTDETEMYQALRIKGSMTDPQWIDVPLIAGDNHVWTVTLDVLPGSYEWGITEDDGSANGIWLLPPGDNLMFTVDAEGNITGTVSFVLEGVSVNDLFAGSISMYPNPARETVTLLSNVMMKEVRMLDLSGRVVYQSNVVAEEHQLNVRGFESGIYFVQIITEEGILTGKLQIQK